MRIFSGRSGLYYFRTDNRVNIWPACVRSGRAGIGGKALIARRGRVIADACLGLPCRYSYIRNRIAPHVPPFYPNGECGPNPGSDAISMMFRHAYDAPISLAWRRSIFARPYIWRFTSLSLFI